MIPEFATPTKSLAEEHLSVLMHGEQMAATSTGTAHVAGTIGGTTYGVAKGVNLVSIRVLNESNSGTLSGIVAGIDWVTANANGPSVANMSLGGGGSNALDTAVRNSINAGITYVTSAGNANADACNYSPARMQEIITVGATTSNDSRASYSNYGNCIDIFAPGSSVRSASFGSNTGTTLMSGTSMAAPHVAGVAALFLQHNSSATPVDVAQAIYSNATMGVVNNANSANNNMLYSLFTGNNNDDGDSGDSGDDGDNGDDGNQCDPVSNDPVVNNVTFNNTRTGPWNRTAVDWSVSDADGNLSSVKVDLMNNTSVLDSGTSNVSGSSASGTTDLRTRNTATGVRVTVTDSNGNSAVRTVNFDGSSSDSDSSSSDDGSSAGNNDPIIDTFNTSTSNQGPNRRLTISWAVSDTDGDLYTIKVDAINGNTVQSETINIGGSNASGSTEFSNRQDGFSGARITVIDQNGNAVSQLKRL
ncbi:MAG: S8 family peptidase [Balneolaceae bacterium]|nr:MAG: S8 family peptidase [Balneolaceae bacterium]